MDFQLDKFTGGKAGIIIKAAVVVIILYYMFGSMSSNWATISPYLQNMNYTLLAASLVPLIAYLVSTIFPWRMILGYMGYDISVNDAIRIKSVTELGKYLPGKVWSVAGRAYMCSRKGIPKTEAFVSTITEIAINLVSGFIIFLVFLPAKSVPWEVTTLAAAAVSVSVILIAKPSVMMATLNAVAGRFASRKVSIEIKGTDLLRVLAAFVATWAVFGISFFLFINSFYPMGIENIGMVTGVFALSLGIGFIVLLAPGGLGVREGLISLLLSAYIPLPLTIAIALLSRIWFMAAEVILAGVSTLVCRVCYD